MNISTDKAIELILYGLAEKIKIGLDMESCVKVAKNDIIGIWSDDMSQIEKETMDIVKQ